MSPFSGKLEEVTFPEKGTETRKNKDTGQKKGSHEAETCNVSIAIINN